MLDELDELRQAIQSGDYHQALALIDDMDEMSRDDKISKIESYMRILLIHLIKQHAEDRNTRSWQASVDEATERLAATNKRRKSGGHYLNEDGLGEALGQMWASALRWAALEAFEGIYTAEQLAAMVDREALLEVAMQRIKQAARWLACKTPMIYRTYIPQPPLSDCVERFWFYDGYAPPHAKERLLPSGTMELVI